MAGMRFLIVVVISMLALSAGCQEEEAADDTPATVTALYSPDADIAGDAKPVLPPEWPVRQLPMYPGAELTSSHYNLGGPDSGCILTLITSDPGEAVLEFYQERVLEAGFEQESYVVASESGAAYYRREDSYFNSGYRIEDGETVVTLMLIFAAAEQQDQAFAGSGQLPRNFPLDILPIYPGATILEAQNMPMDNMILMHVLDTKIDDALSFYQEFYKELGYTTLKSEKSKKTFYNFIFEGPNGGVVLNLTQESDNSVSIDMVYGRRE